MSSPLREHVEQNRVDIAVLQNNIGTITSSTSEMKKTVDKLQYGILGIGALSLIDIGVRVLPYVATLLQMVHIHG